MDAPAVPVIEDLRLSEQTISTLSTAAYWLLVCPWLSCSRIDDACTAASDPAVAAAPAAVSEPSAHEAALKVELRDRGYFTVVGACTPELAAALSRGVLRLVSLGHQPSAIGMYDEAWALAAALTPLLCAVTGNVPNGDHYSFCVRPNFHSFAGPHRDKPAAGGEDPSFRADGSPGYVTAWVALSEATCDMSCLYFVPACHDLGYKVAGDSILAAMPGGPASWDRIVAQPVAAGTCLCFSHRLLHWGGHARDGAAPRVALSFALSHAAFEPAIFDAAYLPFPPLPLRLALRAGQAIAYAAQAPPDKATLALDARLFHAGAHYFTPAYADKIGSAAQWAKYMMASSRGRAPAAAVVTAAATAAVPRSSGAESM